MNTPAIHASGIVKRFRDIVAVNGVDLDIPQGECVGLLGPNGAGKTTTVEILEGLQEPSAGVVRILGMAWRTHARQIQERIGIALQRTYFPEVLTVEETLRLFRSLYARGLEVEEILTLVRLETKRKSRVGNLSGGQAQRLVVGVALVNDPEVVFLDEPTAALDPQARYAIWDIVTELKRRGRTVLITTHYMEEAEKLCDRVIIIDRGTIIAQGTPRDLISELGAEQVIEIRAEPEPALSLFNRVPTLVESTAAGGTIMLSVGQMHQALPVVLQALAESGSSLSHLATRQAGLDDVFMRLTGKSLREEPQVRQAA